MKPDKLLELLTNSALSTGAKDACFHLPTVPARGLQHNSEPVFSTDVLALVNEFKRLKLEEAKLVCLQMEWGR